MNNGDNISQYKRVLIIDDNAYDILINKRIIQKSSFALEVDAKSSALEGLHFLKTTKELPDIIFLDLMMPEMDGFGFLTELEKLDEKLKSKCRIIIVSSSVDPGDIARAQNFKNVLKFISKPLTKAQLDDI